MTFASTGLAAPILDALASLGHTEPTAVQARVLPTVMAGRDVLVSSPTGSGKTGAYLLPALQRILDSRQAAADAEAQAQAQARAAAEAQAAEAGEAPAQSGEAPSEASAPRGRRPYRGRGSRAAQVLVLAPTRELAMQIDKAAGAYGRAMRPFHAAALIGGAPFGAQCRRLADGVDVIVATPGRLMDHLERGRLDLSTIRMLVLDEADRMLDMGFIDDILAISKKLPADRQTVLFSATLDRRIADIARELTRSPERIEVGLSVDRSLLTQVVHYADHLTHKHRMLDSLLQGDNMHQALVFASTKVSTEELSLRLRDAGYPAAALHGDMPQHARNRVVQQLRNGEIGILVATDVAARGIDVPSISHVINFDLPMKAEDYVHRIGRTARAGRSGISVTFVTARDRRNLAGIERLLDEQIPVGVIPGLEPRERQRSSAPGPRAGFKPGGRGAGYQAPDRGDTRAPRHGDGARTAQPDGFRSGQRDGFRGGQRDGLRSGPGTGRTFARPAGAGRRHG
jgi:superfamily II DNA/RNA helicase